MCFFCIIYIKQMQACVGKIMLLIYYHLLLGEKRNQHCVYVPNNSDPIICCTVYPRNWRNVLLEQFQQFMSTFP